MKVMSVHDFVGRILLENPSFCFEKENRAEIGITRKRSAVESQEQESRIGESQEQESRIGESQEQERLTDREFWRKIFEEARKLGILEAQDVYGQDEPILRRDAARIVHQYMKIVQGEADLEDITPAYVLKDLYDCGKCVNHVAQIYLKGIILPQRDDPFIFGMYKTITEAEAEEICDRIVHLEQRRIPAANRHTISSDCLDSNIRNEQIARTGEAKCKADNGGKCSSGEPDKVEFIEDEHSSGESDRVVFTGDEHSSGMSSMCRDDSMCLWVDVRPVAEYERWHLQGAVSAPLGALIKNPYLLKVYGEKHFSLYCEEGEQSRMAANLLCEYGYCSVSSHAIRSPEG